MKAFPISDHLSFDDNRLYKTTLKNLKVYLNHLMTKDPTISRIEIERATHVGSIRKEENT
jgi:hypothetical protein